MKRLLPAIIFALFVCIWACSHLQEPVRAEGATTVIDMSASDFEFKPNNITTRSGSTLTFNIKNVSGTGHNFTIKSPNGEKIRSVDIPAKQSIQTKVTFSQPGTYKFYCDVTGHTALGMKGQVVVSP